MNSRLPKVVFVAIAVYAVIHFRADYARMPRIVSSHFNAHGEPNDWEQKPVFLGIFAGSLAIAAIITFGGSLIVRTVPPELINLPYKQRWLSPEFRAATLHYLDRWFAWLGCAVLLLMVTTFDYAIQANLDPAHRLDSTRLWSVLAFFGIFTAVWMLRFFMRFGRPSGSTGSEGPK